MSFLFYGSLLAIFMFTAGVAFAAIQATKTREHEIRWLRRRISINGHYEELRADLYKQRIKLLEERPPVSEARLFTKAYDERAPFDLEVEETNKEQGNFLNTYFVNHYNKVNY